MGKRIYLNKKEGNSGFTLLEVLISILILSVIISSATAAFVYAARTSRDNKLGMAAMNLANEAVEDIRALKFAEVGTKIIVSGTTIYGDPGGEILQSQTRIVDGVEYTVNTTISWEEQGGWDLGATDWDYKSVRVCVFPVEEEGNPLLTKVIETYVTRDSTQPALTGSNISLRLIRGWNTLPGTKVPVINAKVSLTAGPSAPRQVQTSSAGVARFINLISGSYRLKVDPGSLGMILHPDQTADWVMSLSGAVTNTKELEAEYPCSLRISLRDLEDYPIQMDSKDTGSVKIEVPYGSDISKSFSSADIDINGYLPQDFITGLWPVGDGYSGAYTVSEVSIDQCQYLGSYEKIVSGEIPWNGTFDEPGTTKDIIFYFGTIPGTPSGTDTNWVDAYSSIVTEPLPSYAHNEKETDLADGRFESGDTEKSIYMPEGISADFNAIGLYFENTGTETVPGLYINGGSNLILHAAQVIFRGSVVIEDTGTPGGDGKITLRTVYSDGIPASLIDGSLIGGTPGITYGKLYLAGPLISDGVVIQQPGGYYFYDGLVLPDNISQLIPITKENYYH